jgi:predicted DNA-binding protein
VVRDVRFELRMTEEERDRLKELAYARGMSSAVYLREMILVKWGELGAAKSRKA